MGRSLGELLDGLPPDLAQQAFAHASWTARRADASNRLAFLGDAVLALALTEALHAELDPGRHGAGRLTQIRAQAVSRRSCRRVAERLGLPDRLRAAAPADLDPRVVAGVLGSEGPVAEAMEAALGACHLAYGYEAVAEATREAFGPELAQARERDVDFKSALQEALARRGEEVRYAVVEEAGPPHERTFGVAATVAGREVGRGAGRSKKEAEQAAAQAALGEEAPCT